MSETVGTGAPGKTGQNVTEAYAFACMSCGHGWEQAYEIEHHQDASGVNFVTYLADGAQVPSPLTRPSCLNCDGHTVRIMRSGQVSDVTSLRTARRAAPAAPAAPAVRGTHHWSVLHFLHHRHDERTDTV